MYIRSNLAAWSAIGLLIAAAAQAQKATPSPDSVMQMLSTRLNLDDAQRSAIAPVIADRQDKLRHLRDDGGSMRAHRREAREILSDSDKKIDAVLSPDQQQKYKELEKQMIERVRQGSAAP